jgi:hypothetical protein
MKQQTERFKAGDFVYFSAYSEKKDSASFFLCRGYVTGLAPGPNITYKLIVTEVYPESLLCGYSPELAKGLLGRKISRPSLMFQINHWSLVIGTKEPTREWLKPNQKTNEYIKTYLKSKNINASI